MLLCATLHSENSSKILKIVFWEGQKELSELLANLSDTSGNATDRG